MTSRSGLSSRKEAWHAIWEGKGRTAGPVPADADAALTYLLRLGGYDSPTAGLSLERFREEVRHLAGWMGLLPTETIFEVGCGAGAVLQTIAPQCAAVGGI